MLGLKCANKELSAIMLGGWKGKLFREQFAKAEEQLICLDDSLGHFFWGEGSMIRYRN